MAQNYSQLNQIKFDLLDQIQIRNNLERAPYEQLFQDYSKLMQEYSDLKQQLKSGQGHYNGEDGANRYSLMDSSSFSPDSQLDLFYSGRTATQSFAGSGGPAFSRSVMFPQKD